MLVAKIPCSIVSVSRKTQGSFFAFKKIMDSSKSSLATKISIFHTYISSRWLWASPAVFPTTALLRKIDAMRNTLLLSLLRLPADGLLDWVTNEVSRRRSVRVLCEPLPGIRSGENSFLDTGHTGGTQQGKMQIVLSGLLSRASTGFESAEDTLRQQG